MRRWMFLLGLLALLVPCACEEPQKIIAVDPPGVRLAVMESLSRAYLTQDLGLFTSLLANDPATHAEFVFLFNRPTSRGETQWDRSEEIRLHQRMFAPEGILPDDSPLPTDRWLDVVTPQFTQLGSFRERLDLYSENGGLDGKLDAERWRAMAARYATYMLLECAENDYLVDTESSFVVIEDRSKGIDEAGKFLIYRWEELCNGPSKAESAAIFPHCLSRVKDSYR